MWEKSAWEADEVVVVVIEDRVGISEGLEEIAVGWVEIVECWLDKMDSLNEAFLFNLVTFGCLVSLGNGMLLAGGGAKTDLQAKHLTGMAGFLRGLLQRLQESSEIMSISEQKLSAITAWLKVEMSCQGLCRVGEENEEKV